MEWSVFAVLQMCIITVGVSLAMWLRIRAVNAQNQLLRDHLENQENTVVEQPDPAAWLQSQLAGLADDDAAAAVCRVVLEQTLNATEDFEQRLQQAIEASGLVSAAPADGDNAELQARIDELEAALSGASEQESNDHADELKALLQQFTHDSREMMACIQTLEAENAELRELLGDQAPPIVSPEAPASTPDDASAEDAEATQPAMTAQQAEPEDAAIVT